MVLQQKFKLLEIMKKMAKIVDKQNKDKNYINMSDNFERITCI